MLDLPCPVRHPRSKMCLSPSLRRFPDSLLRRAFVGAQYDHRGNALMVLNTRNPRQATPFFDIFFEKVCRGGPLASSEQAYTRVTRRCRRGRGGTRDTIDVVGVAVPASAEKGAVANAPGFRCRLEYPPMRPLIHHLGQQCESSGFHVDRRSGSRSSGVKPAEIAARISSYEALLTSPRLADGTAGQEPG